MPSTVIVIVVMVVVFVVMVVLVASTLRHIAALPRQVGMVVEVQVALVGHVGRTLGALAQLGGPQPIAQLA